jgi:hypothetical protein
MSKPISSEPTASVTNTLELDLTFEGNKISGVWYHPDLADFVCAICGKQCKELGKPICVNVNPFCG